jgi:hypothetical protein
VKLRDSSSSSFVSRKISGVHRIECWTNPCADLDRFIKSNRNRVPKRILGQERVVTAEWRKLHSQMLHIFLFIKYCEEDKTRKIKRTTQITRDKKIRVEKSLMEQQWRKIKNLGDGDANSRIILK